MSEMRLDPNLIARLDLIGRIPHRERSTVARDEVRPVFRSWRAFEEFITERGFVLLRHDPDELEVFRVA